MPVPHPFTADQVAIALGTRPEAIKLWGLVVRLGPAARLVHTGQHYDEDMWAGVIDELPGMDIDHHIGVGGMSRGEQIGSATAALTRHLLEHPARALVVQGDTNAALAGALAANGVGIPVVHLEAGLRSDDRAMPEEINRVLVDALADLCCAPTRANAARLGAEGVSPERVCVTGNTLAEAIERLLPEPAARDATLASFGVAAGGYVLATLHRANNVDEPGCLRSLLEGLASLAREVPVLLPLHPRTQARASRFGLTPLLDDLRVLPPLAPRQFLSLEAEARLLLSDSGGVQEEAALLRRPLVVLRDTTERPELVSAGWCRLLGADPPRAVIARAWQDAPSWLGLLSEKTPPYGATEASARVLAEIDRRWPARTLGATATASVGPAR